VGLEIISKFITIYGNIIYNNSFEGIRLSGNTVETGTNLSISCNLIANNKNGISSGFNSTISYNHIKKNQDYGITDAEWHNMHNTTIYLNNFEGNNKNSSINSQVSVNPTNNISNNYWDDWLEPDSDKDGVVDLPYVIPNIQWNNDNNSDPYPHKKPIDLHSYCGSSINFTYISVSTTNDRIDPLPLDYRVLILFGIVMLIILLRWRRKRRKPSNVELYPMNVITDK
ncbi:MAG: hypothetical protein ACXAD7_23005, partial [Candidatus Kariarchaeaceae archaeon]